MVTALGEGWSVNAEGFRSGRTAFRRVQGFDVSRQRTQMAAEVDVRREMPSTGLSARQERRMDRAGRMLLVAAAEAWKQAGWETGIEGLPVVLGTTSGGMALGEEFYRRASRVPAGLRGAGGTDRPLPTATSGARPDGCLRVPRAVNGDRECLRVGIECGRGGV